MPIERIIDCDTNTFILFDDASGEVIHKEPFEQLRKKRGYSKKRVFKGQLHQPILTLFSYTMTKNEYKIFYKLLEYFTSQGELTMRLTEIAKLEDISISSLKNMVSKYRLKNTKNMMYLITNQYPEVYY